MTLYEALVAFKDIYDSAVSTGSKREIEIIDRNWNTVNNEMTLCYHALAAGDDASAEDYLNNIVTVLNGYNLTVDLPVQMPISMSVISSPSTILIPSDNDGGNPVYTNAISAIQILVGYADETSNWTFTLGTQTNVTAVIQNSDEVKIDAITADLGSVIVIATREGYSNLNILISVQKQKTGETGGVDNIDGTTIVEDLSGNVKANLIEVNSNKTTYGILPTTNGNLDDIVGAASNNNVSARSTFTGAFTETTGETTSELSDNIFIDTGFIAPTSAVVSLTRNFIRVPGKSVGDSASYNVNYAGLVLDNSTYLENYSIYFAGGAFGVPPRKFTSNSTGLGYQPITPVSGCFSIGLKSTFSNSTIYDYANSSSYSNQSGIPQKISFVLEAWTRATLRGTSNLTYPYTSDMKLLNWTDGYITSTPANNLTFTTATIQAYPEGGIENLFANITYTLYGIDLNTKDTFFTEYTMSLNGSGITGATETTAKRIATGTLVGSTCAFASTSGSFLPSVTSASTNPCKWQGVVDAVVLYAMRA